MSITEVTIIHHVGIVLILLWLLSSSNYCHPVFYFLSLIYLYLVHERYEIRLQRKLKFEERREANKERVLSDTETVRWLNHAVERIWPVCMEQIVSQKILLPVVPWFLQKYKPWTAKEIIVQHLYLGRTPPMLTDIRVLHQSTDDDHLVLELGLNFLSAEDMSAVLAVKLRKRLGLGISTKLHLTGMHIEGKVLVGVKFLHTWPFLGRVRICFVEPPYFQLNVKPIFNHGIDVTELPGIAGWLDKLLALAFEESLVKPNMLVVDVEKLLSPHPESWFTVDAKDPIAYAVVEVIQATDMKPSDLNGLADPYVKGQLGLFRFRTKTQKKTLAPKWHEEFKVPIWTWESPNVLAIEVCDKDHFIDDILGDCFINLGDFRDGQRHAMWLSLQNIEMGRLHLAVTILEVNKKVAVPADGETLNNKNKENRFSKATVQQSCSSSELSKNSLKVADKFEPINIVGQQETGIWVHRPGSEVEQIWECRKGKSRLLDSQNHEEGGDSVGSLKLSVSGSCYNDSSGTDDSLDGNKTQVENRVRRGLHKISSIFHKSPRNEDQSRVSEDPLPSPYASIKAMDAKETYVKSIPEENLSAPSSDKDLIVEENGSPGQQGLESHNKKEHMKDMAKSILKHAGKSAMGIKLAIKWRASKNRKSESGTRIMTEENVVVVSDPSDEESLPSSVDMPIVENIAVVSNHLTLSDSCSDSFVSQECISEGASYDNPANIVNPTNRVGVEDFERSSAEQSGIFKGAAIDIPSVEVVSMVSNPITVSGCGSDSFNSQECISEGAPNNTACSAASIVTPISKAGVEDFEMSSSEQSGSFKSVTIDSSTVEEVSVVSNPMTGSGGNDSFESQECIAECAPKNSASSILNPINKSGIADFERSSANQSGSFKMSAIDTPTIDEVSVVSNPIAASGGANDCFKSQECIAKSAPNDTAASTVNPTNKAGIEDFERLNDEQSGSLNK